MTAEALKEAGFTVTILSKDEQRTKTAAEEVSCEYVVADVSDSGAVEKAFNEAEKINGQVDILINNAGVWIQGPIENDDPKKVKRALEVNTLGPIILYANRGASNEKTKSRPNYKCYFAGWTIC